MSSDPLFGQGLSSWQLGRKTLVFTPLRAHLQVPHCFEPFLRLSFHQWSQILDLLVWPRLLVGSPSLHQRLTPSAPYLTGWRGAVGVLSKVPSQMRLSQRDRQKVSFHLSLSSINSSMPSLHLCLLPRTRQQPTSCYCYLC